MTVEKAKEYLRVDSNLEDALIENLILLAEKFCADVARMEVVEFEEIGELAKVSTLYSAHFYCLSGNSKYRNFSG